MGSSRSKVTAFKWTDCGGTEEHFKNLYVAPDPLILPGNIMVAASAIFNAKLDSPLQTNLTIEKKVGSTYVKIPCIDNFGSCVYDDLCEILEGATCPEILHRNGINCTCPFPARTYLLSLSKFDARSFYFPSGDYHARGELGMNGNSMGCLDVYLSIAQNW